MRRNKSTPLYWTAGFDSTFRLCQLLWSKTVVQPIYIAKKIDARSKATRRIEQFAVEKLREKILIDYPFTRDYLLPNIVVKESEMLPVYHDMDKMAKRIGYGNKGGERMGTQYERLCRYAKWYHEHHGVPIEIGIEVGGRAERILKGHLIKIGTDQCQLKPSSQLTDRDLEIFRWMRFPIYHLKKDDMLKIADENGFLEILEYTHSCWYPRKGKIPCGRCPMCKRRVIKQKVLLDVFTADDRKSKKTQRQISRSKTLKRRSLRRRRRH
jgi:hypothetical protein